MADIVTDLRDRAYSGKVPDSLSERAADEIDRLRSRVRFCDGVIRSGDVAAITEAEREALERGICFLTGVEDLPGCVDPMDDACTIRNLLDRLGGERPQSADIALRNNLRLCRDMVEQLRGEKAADWKAACESAEAASKEITRLKRIIEDYATICAASCREINGLQEKLANCVPAGSHLGPALGQDRTDNPAA